MWSQCFKHLKDWNSDVLTTQTNNTILHQTKLFDIRSQMKAFNEFYLKVYLFKLLSDSKFFGFVKNAIYVKPILEKKNVWNMKKLTKLKLFFLKENFFAFLLTIKRLLWSLERHTFHIMYNIHRLVTNCIWLIESVICHSI